MIAMALVINLRSQGFSRMCRKPSITIWPANVPVKVEFWPEASKAIANKVLAMVAPSKAVRNLCASMMSAAPW
jgi:hypothetical protein